jgi:hypothetical protein
MTYYANPAAETAATVAAALAMRAQELRLQARSRKLAGPQLAPQRVQRRADADRYDQLARRIMRMDAGQLATLHTLLAS